MQDTSLDHVRLKGPTHKLSDVHLPNSIRGAKMYTEIQRKTIARPLLLSPRRGWRIGDGASLRPLELMKWTLQLKLFWRTTGL